MRLLVIHDTPCYAAQTSYVFDVLLASLLGLNYDLLDHQAESVHTEDFQDCLVITYGDPRLLSLQAQHQLHIHKSNFFGSDYLAPQSLPASPLSWTLLGEERLPILYRASQQLKGHPELTTIAGQPIAVRGQDGRGQLICTNLDLVASSFFMLSRYEEALLPNRDRFGRFPLEAHLAYREGFWRTPIVNLYAQLLHRWIGVLSGGTLRPRPPRYPGERRFGLCLTHDVDHPRKFTPPGVLNTLGKVLLGRQSPRALKQVADYVFTGRDPFWNFDEIVESERESGFDCTFFLAAGHTHECDPDYACDPLKRGHLYQTIAEIGPEIGLHGSFESYTNADLLRVELSRLDRRATIVGNRQHYLRLDVQHSFDAMEEAGLAYDCTLAFSDEIGFRSGLACPHFVFSLKDDRPFAVLEIPLIVMDRSIWTIAQSRETPPEEMWEDLLQVLEQVRVHNGCASVLWHNGFFDDVVYPGYSDMYHSVLTWLKEKGGWGASGRQVYDWFVANRAK